MYAIVLLLISAAAPQTPEEIYNVAKTHEGAGNFAEAAIIYQALANFTVLSEYPQYASDFLKDEAIAWRKAAMFKNSMAALRRAQIMYSNESLFYYAMCSDFNRVSEYHRTDFGISNDIIESACLNATKIEALNGDYWYELAYARALMGNPEKAFPAVLHIIQDLETDKLLNFTIPLGLVYRAYFNVLMDMGLYERAADEIVNLNWAKNLDRFEVAWLSAKIFALKDAFHNESLQLLHSCTVQFSTQFENKDSAVCGQNKTWTIFSNWTATAELFPKVVRRKVLMHDAAPYGNNSLVFVGPRISKHVTVYNGKSVILVNFKKHVYMASTMGTLYKSCKFFVGDKQNIDYMRFPSTAVEKAVEEKVAAIIQRDPYNYYQFIADTIPKFSYLLDEVLTKKKGQGIHLLVKSGTLLDQILSLRQFKKIKERVIEYPNQVPIATRMLLKKGVILVDWSDNNAKVDFWSTYYSPRKALLKSRKFLKDLLTIYPVPNPTNPENDIVLIHRNNSRAIYNEKYLMTRLQRAFPGRVAIHYGNQSVLEQVELFSHAKVVIGGHGTGLANFIFTPPGAGLVTFTTRIQTDFRYWQMAAALQRNHWVITDIPGSNIKGNYPLLTAKQVDSVIHAAQEALANFEGSAKGDFEK